VTDAERFLLELGRDVPKSERLILCAFKGDPQTAGFHAWRPKSYYPGNEIVIPENGNGYVAVSSFALARDGTWRRRTESFAAGLALMVDDVGTKVEVKPGWPRPTAVVETSPGNYQWWYFLHRTTDIAKFDGAIRAFISGQLLGADPGMAGINRVGRLPGFLNMKEKYIVDGKHWRCRLAKFNPEIRYDVDALIAAFGLQITVSAFAAPKTPRQVTEEHLSRPALFAFTYKWLARHSMILDKRGPDKSGWIQIICPWAGDHTGGERANTGTAIREPAPENDWYGAFQCHHGHCNEKTWRDLTDWIAEQQAETFDEVNSLAPSFEELMESQRIKS
jgi:hypothetical protein